MTCPVCAAESCEHQPPAAQPQRRDYNPIGHNDEENILKKALGKMPRSATSAPPAVVNVFTDAQKTILDCLIDLQEAPLTDHGGSIFDAAELRLKTEALRMTGFILISCEDMSLARSAAFALADGIRIPPGRRKLLDLHKHADPLVDIHDFKRGDADLRESLAVFIDAYHETGQAFVDSLFSERAVWSQGQVHYDFSKKGLSLICLAEPRKLSTRLTAARRPPPCWQISFLQTRLRSLPGTHAKQLETEITRQRQLGRWASDDDVFCDQIQRCLDDDNLVTVVSKGGPFAEADEELRFPSHDQPLHIAVLHTAAYYSNLAPNEFSHVLCTLLGNRKTLVPETIRQRTKDGFELVELKHEKPLVDLWHDSSDPTLDKCGLVNSRTEGRGITFADINRREQIRRHFDEHYGVYVQDQFLLAWEKELLFDTSDAIAANVIANTIEMAGSYPRQFGCDWLFDIIVERFADEAAADLAAFNRIARLLREMLSHPSLANDVVLALIQKLLATANHQLALDIVLRLRGAAGFDELYWLKELANRGTESVRAGVYLYLRRELRRRGSGAYRFLHALESWSPDPTRANYSPANRLVLDLVMEYALEITARFDFGQYGKWPSRFPLLATDVLSAKEDFSLIVRWLLHPGMQSAMNDDSDDGWIRVISALFSEWVFILLGSPEPEDGEDQAAAARDAAPAAESSAFSPDLALHLLLQQILDVTISRQLLREAMLNYWEDMKNFLSLLPVLFADLGRAHRRELAWKRNLIRRLITDFRRLQRELRAGRAETATA